MFTYYFEQKYRWHRIQMGRQGILTLPLFNPISAEFCLEESLFIIV